MSCVRCSGLACVDPVTDASGFPYRPSFEGGTRLVHRGWFVWTSTPPLSGRRTPHLGPAGLPGAFWCASPFLWPFLVRSLLVRPPPGVTLFVVVVGFFSFTFSPFPPLVVPSLCPALRVFRPRVRLALASCRTPPPFFLAHPPVVSDVSCFPVAWGLCPPPLFFSFVSCFPFFRFFFLFFCRLCGAGRVRLGWAVGCARVCLGGAVPVVALCALAGVAWFSLLGLAVLCCLLVGLGVVLRWCCPCLAAWLAALWFGVVCLGVPLPRVVFCCAVLSCGGVLSCSAVCLRRCLRLLFVSCRCASAVCVLGCRAVCSLPSPPWAVLCCAVLVPFRCAVRVLCAVSGGWCCWFLVSLPFVGGLLVALVARRCRLVVCVGFGARVWSGRRSASSLWCPVPLCCVLWRCAAVWCCAVVPCLLILFFSLLVALVSCCSPLVLGSGPVPGRFCFCALPVRCCAGVPASLLSVRCSLALAGLTSVLCCCLLCLCVCCWAWLSSVVSWWVLVAPGVVSRWCAVVCPWVLCCAVLLRVVPPGVALLCAVLFCFALFGAAARCVVSWGAVRRLGVLSILAPCFVLSPRAVCVLLWCVAARCCSPLCFVPSAPWDVVLCISCRLEESLLASRGVFRVHFWGVGLGRHEDSVCPVENPPLGVRSEDVDGGLLGGRVQGVPRCDG